MERYSHLPAELSYELAQFVPGPYCRKLLISSCFLFYNLLCKSKRALFWKIGTIAERESNAIYRFPNGNQYRALSPRNGIHRHMAHFLLQNGNNMEQFLRRANGMVTILISLRTTAGQVSTIKIEFIRAASEKERSRLVNDLTENFTPRNWMNDFFESDATGMYIARRYGCEFSYDRLEHNYEWDVCTITWHNDEAAVDNWNQLFHYLYAVLRTVDNGNVPLSINVV